MSRRSERDDALLNNDFIDFDAFFGERRKPSPHPRHPPRSKAAQRARQPETTRFAQPPRNRGGRGPCS